MGSPEKMLTSETQKFSNSILKRGILSRWVQRFFVLTTKFIQCFKVNNNKITRMGKFLFQVKLTDLSELDIFERLDGTVVIAMQHKDTKGYIRSETTKDTRDWYMAIDSMMTEAKKSANTEDSGSNPFLSPGKCFATHGRSLGHEDIQTSCKMGPVVRLSMAVDQELVFGNEAKNGQRSRGRSFLSPQCTMAPMRSRSSSSIARI